jgi:RNA polymerase subunit RPABC4/transcription elongation factor Spt4
VTKEQWKKCSHCQIITDLDEENCPNRGLEDNPHLLQIVELEKEELKQLRKARKIYTKHWAELERRLSQ